MNAFGTDFLYGSKMMKVTEKMSLPRKIEWLQLRVMFKKEVCQMVGKDEKKGVTKKQLATIWNRGGKSRRSCNIDLTY